MGILQHGERIGADDQIKCSWREAMLQVRALNELYFDRNIRTGLSDHMAGGVYTGNIGMWIERGKTPKLIPGSAAYLKDPQGTFFYRQ